MKPEHILNQIPITPRAKVAFLFEKAGGTSSEIPRNLWKLADAITKLEDEYELQPSLTKWRPILQQVRRSVEDYLNDLL